jgi:hypothetical protein
MSNCVEFLDTRSVARQASFTHLANLTIRPATIMDAVGDPSVRWALVRRSTSVEN